MSLGVSPRQCRPGQRCRSAPFLPEHLVRDHRRVDRYDNRNRQCGRRRRCRRRHFRLLEASDLDDLLLFETERRRAEASTELLDEIVETGSRRSCFSTTSLRATSHPFSSRTQLSLRTSVMPGRNSVARCGLGISENHTTASPSRSAATTHWLISASLAARDLTGRARLDHHRAGRVERKVHVADRHSVHHRESRVRLDAVDRQHQVDAMLGEGGRRRLSDDGDGLVLANQDVPEADTSSRPTRRWTARSVAKRTAALRRG